MSAMVRGQRGHYARGRERRDALIDSAIEVIAERGLERVTFRMVAEHAGYPPSTTSYFFATVDELVVAAVNRVAETITRRVDSLLQMAREGLLSHEQLASSLVDLVANQDNSGSIAQFEAYLAVRRRPELGPPVHRIMGVLEEAARQTFEVLGVADPSISARLLVGLLDGYTLHEIAWPSGPESRDMLRDLLSRMLDTHGAPPVVQDERC